MTDKFEYHMSKSLKVEGAAIALFCFCLTAFNAFWALSEPLTGWTVFYTGLGVYFAWSGIDILLQIRKYW